MRRLIFVALALTVVLLLAEPAAAPELSRRPMAVDIADCRIPETSTPKPDPRDVQLLAQVVWNEARGECYEGKVAVAAVVVNRMRDSRWPDRLDQILVPGQFAISRSGQRPDVECVRAAEEALAGRDPTGGAVFFYNDRDARCRWIRSRPVVTQIGEHTFAK